jgi:hypothetical protein
MDRPVKAADRWPLTRLQARKKLERACKYLMKSHRLLDLRPFAPAGNPDVEAVRILHGRALEVWALRCRYYRVTLSHDPSPGLDDFCREWGIVRFGGEAPSAARFTAPLRSRLVLLGEFLHDRWLADTIEEGNR